MARSHRRAAGVEDASPPGDREERLAFLKQDQFPESVGEKQQPQHKGMN